VPSWLEKKKYVFYYLWDLAKYLGPLIMPSLCPPP
jgi:hypothetical protein